MTSITWAGPRCVQELATFLGPQNRTQGRCDDDVMGSAGEEGSHGHPTVYT